MKLKSVMFIDDDADDQLMFNEATRLIDPTIRRLSAYNGLEALQILSGKNAIVPTIIFLDINMPLMNGRECFQALKKMELLSNVPIVICSTSKFASDQEEFNALGADYYLIKPNTFLGIINVLNYVFDTCRSNRSRRSIGKLEEGKNQQVKS